MKTFMSKFIIIVNTWDICYKPIIITLLFFLDMFFPLIQLFLYFQKMVYPTDNTYYF